MLTKEYLRFKKRNGIWTPSFIDPTATAFLEIADTLLSCYQSALKNRSRRGEIAEEVEPTIKGSRDPNLAQAFDKLIQDAATFDAVKDLDYVALRSELLKKSSELLSSNHSDYDNFYKNLQLTPEFQLFESADIYGDLPENEQLTKLKSLTPLELTFRYNVAQVQGLLLYAHKLKISLKAPEPAELRRLFKYLKFFRLLSEITRHGKDISLEISGPFELFANTRKYALQLASFFPALLLMPQWQLEFEAEFNRQKGVVKLKNSEKLRSHYRNFSSYIPEEIAMFHRLFREKVQDWQIVGEAPLIEIGNGRVAFPDLSFKNMESNAIIHLELFHRWHKYELENRLELLAKKSDLNLILGIDRSLINDSDFALLEAKYPTLLTRIFRFRDFPGVDRVRTTLNKFPRSL